MHKITLMKQPVYTSKVITTVNFEHFTSSWEVYASETDIATNMLLADNANVEREIKFTSFTASKVKMIVTRAGRNNNYCSGRLDYWV